MNRVTRASAVAARPAPPVPGTPGYFTGGNPGGQAATVPGYEWYNSMQETLMYVIEQQGLTGSHTDDTLLYKAIQSMITGHDFKDSVRVAAPGNIAIAAPGANIDGIAMFAGQSVLLLAQTAPLENGLYIWNGAAVPMTRRADSDTGAELNGGTLVPVEEGATYADSLWMCTNDGTVVIGTTALVFARRDVAANSAAVQGSFRNLAGFAPGTSAVVTYTIDEIVTGDGAGNYQTTRAWNNTITMTTLGAGGLDVGAVAANTQYYAYAITQPNGTKACIASLSATAPSFANAAAYTKYAGIGSFVTDNTANKYPFNFVQVGRNIQYRVAAGTNVATARQMTSGALGNTSTPTYVAVSTSGFAPPRASKIFLYAQTGAAALGVAPNNSYGAVSPLSGTNPPPIASNTTTAFGQSGDFVLESSNLYYCASASAAALYCRGYEDNF